MAETTRAQFEQQEDFISFDASPPPQPQPPQLQSASTSNARKRRISDRHGPAPQDNDDEDDQQQGTRRLRDRERARSTPWCLDPGVDWARYARATDQLNAEAHAFVRYISPTPLEHELRLHTIELIRRTVRSKYPDSDVECFGSVGTGLYLPGGDIDLVVLSPSMPSPPLKPSSSLLHRLASLLLTSSIAAPQSLVVIAKARVPIVKFTTRYGGFSVDLSVNQKNGIDAAVRVRSILEEYAFREEGYVEPGAAASGLSIKGKGKGKATGGEEEGGKVDDAQTLSHPVDHGVARSLVLLVKAFLSQRGMNEVFTGGLGSYSIICMVVSFLQVRAPCLSLLLTGWQTTETNNLLLSSSGDTPLSLSRGQLHPRIQTAQINPNRNIGLLFVEFLELYGKHFNYDQAGITLKGRGGYFNKHDKGWYRPQQPYLLSIEDPNDPRELSLSSPFVPAGVGLQRPETLMRGLCPPILPLRSAPDKQRTTSRAVRTRSCGSGKPLRAGSTRSLRGSSSANRSSRLLRTRPSSPCRLTPSPTPIPTPRIGKVSPSSAASSGSGNLTSTRARQTRGCTTMGCCSAC